MAPTLLESASTDVLPDELWGHELFRDSATFREPATPLLAERMDIRLRILRHQPSSADATAESMLRGMNQLYSQAKKWIDPACPEADLLSRLDRLQHMLASPVSDELLHRGLRSALSLIPPDLQTYAPPLSGTRQDLADRLELIAVLLMETCLGRHELLSRRYRKRLYVALDNALSFNATTDTKRLWPVLRWVRDILTRQGRSGCAYADVGCAAAAGAPGMRVAQDLLQRNGLCAQLHGIDVVPPARRLAVDMARQHMLLYASDPLTRPLPRRYDVILLANMHRHLTLALQRRLFLHLSRSLNEYGLLFVNWRFSDAHSPCLCLEKRRGRLWTAHEWNCV